MNVFAHLDQQDRQSNPDARVLSTKKANYGRTGSEINLTWRNGVFVADPVESGLDRMASNAKAERVFLNMLRLFEGQGRYVSPNPSVSFAPTQFAKHPDAEGVTKRALTTAMEALLQSGRVKIGDHGRGSESKKHLEIGDV